MAKRDWVDASTSALAKLGPRVRLRALRGGARIAYALTGKRMQVRTRFLDVSKFGGDFDASAQALRRRVPDVFEVVEREPDRATIRIHALEYRQIDLLVHALEYRQIDLLEPYREFAISALVRHRGVAGELVLEMPVTTEEARWGGVWAYGFPRSWRTSESRRKAAAASAT